MRTILILLRVVVKAVPNKPSSVLTWDGWGYGGRMALDVHATATARLRSDGQRYTTGRRAIVDALAGSARPVTFCSRFSVRDRSSPPTCGSASIGSSCW